MKTYRHFVKTEDSNDARSMIEFSESGAKMHVKITVEMCIKNLNWDLLQEEVKAMMRLREPDGCLDSENKKGKDS